MLKAYRVRLYPTYQQQVLINKQLGCCRVAYNWFLGRRIEYYEQHKKTISYNDLSAEFTLMKQTPEFVWMNEVAAQCLQNTLRRCDRAFKDFFKRGKGFPKFKSKYDHCASFESTQSNKVDNVKRTVGVTKISNIHFRDSRDIEGDVRSIIISKAASGKYYASVVVKDRMIEPIPMDVCEESMIGLDVGLESFVVSSDGEKISNPRHFKKGKAKLAKHQKILARKVKGSKSREEQRKRVARCHERISNMRRDFHHQITSRMIAKDDVVAYAVEDLSIKNMVKNEKLSSSIADAGWGQCIVFLDYKARRVGKRVVKVGRFFASSKTCSSCGYKLEELDLSVRQWMCPSCGSVHDRDVNASINIKIEALRNISKTG